MPLQDLINEAGEQSDEKIIKVMETAARCAYAGAAVLDRLNPNWVEAITRELDLGDSCSCVLGQVYDPRTLPDAIRTLARNLVRGSVGGRPPQAWAWSSGYGIGRVLIGHELGLDAGSCEMAAWLVRHGFDVQDGPWEPEFGDLNWAWERIIAERRRPSPFQVVAEVEVVVDEETGAEARARRDAEWAAAGRPPAGPLPELPAGWTSPHAEGDLHGCSVPGCEVCP
jgi:hypothetical protein